MSALDRLAEAISYPSGECQPGAARAVFLADDVEVVVLECKGRLRFVHALGPTTEMDFSTLARFAAGRLLKEEAALAWDPHGRQLLLWQEVSSGVANAEMAQSFESFLVSCDWWKARMKELAKAVGGPSAEMVILP